MQNKLVLIYDMSTNTTLFGKLVRECYTERNSSALREVKRLSGPGSHREQDFEKLFGFHYKLGKVVSVSGHLISAAISLRQEFANGFKVRTVPHAQDRKIPLVAKKLKIGGVVNRMFKANDAQRDLYHERLRSLHSEAELEKILCAGVKVQTRVHAELLLIDHFERNKAVFLDGDKYIGCSKPACYLCYHYISNHPNGYTTPPSHQKLYLAWRVPDTQKNDITHLQTQEKIMSKLIEKVREDLKREMRSQKPALPLHPDSTCGLTTTAPSLAPFMDLSGLAQSLED
ncbi:hypothetical protein L228DRAFT_62976 [Xylona heveae TC161]|uniref:Uncharacterized protein n=1 Tax=Xylona heveae (strain CBS 132557 / TC161) TaxID=1328760 RepID=A0A165INQ3_XYLHT|nr:hypothetical protein L228DRAFT_62976 [Xylona heveae TC161]KZF25163.1 hypothetical protein L228DRAFT_62976 [Xylona heveae TC161]